MSEEKQIEKMAWDLCAVPKHPSIKSCEQCGNKHCHAMYYAKRVYNADYRKQSDVINEFIKRAIDLGVCKDNGDGTERLFVSTENLRKIAREIKGDSDDL